MSWVRLFLILASSFGLLSGCASNHPPNRLEQYLGPPEAISSPVPLPTDRPIRASLVVIEDRSGPNAAPALPDEVHVRIAEQIRNEINGRYPLVIDKVIPSVQLTPGNGLPDLIAFGKQQGVHYLLITVLSSEEQQYPVSLFLGWTTHMQPGFRLDNWSLAEAGLLDVATGQVVLQAEGRAWATLDSPTAPGINQWYPVIYLRPQDPERRIWPPTYEGAPITLRLVSMREAAKRLVLNVQQAWIEKRQVEIAGMQP